MKVLVRITRHPFDAAREAFLKSVFGSDLVVVTDDIRYGDDAVASVKELIQRIESETGGEIVAVEVQAPPPALIRLVDRQRDLGVVLIRAQFERDEFGRAIVEGKDESGRDLLQFSHYEVLEQIVFKTKKLEPMD
ncbi:hypothetical protein A2609_03380 [Candidatus Kaiserbacteria bacterium RIFOXYD1_FULL_47_14]|uniref:Uncharacterized protein n=1 Tax=Candidatus Kaiserbacteria bacterium RIFOXYD1_FULL_47_14 TaxID=1798533 RepID=A0A1F6G431_9BACT|nr:MAG: hypothetical protein A2609_03380 [Candidatus Kaiserbacteria bacterium RIFOXYD1_FULL_47_14]